MKASILIAAEILGGQAALARAAGVSQPAAFKWLHQKSKPGPLAVLAIEQATDGKVSRHDLRPDIYPLPSSDNEPSHPQILPPSPANSSFDSEAKK